MSLSSRAFKSPIGKSLQTRTISSTTQLLKKKAPKSTPSKSTKSDAALADTTVVLPTKGKKVGKSRDWDEAQVETTHQEDEAEGSFDLSFNDFTNKQKEIVNKTKKDLETLVNRVGRVTPDLLDSVSVEIDKELFNLQSVASVSVKDGSSLIISVFDASMIRDVEKAIFAANLGLTPQKISENVLKCLVPRPAADTKSKLAKDAAGIAENARIALRLRRQALQKIVNKQKTGKSTNDLRTIDKMMDEATITHSKSIDDLLHKAQAALR
ncbi:ribosome recycling factor [Wallemia mellicola]|uniref:Ribosome recycling factor n=1 Tax=Wallemia mellicola TaxID=1708541 RepID=A0A4T0R6D1_9BASI|nr:hypothetical protein E3Q24_00219 [Wallemia mellicola]TIB78489.1 hypothetical protein E3Q23_00740 [Wallemia mellicola]TIB81218.1 ribosome recycling factor [Wallemia mellicola]TIB89183.1 ribosome recycling factor [Wallemia mellicola]TIB91596.1 ribosome recycling factor [Wallemia mellicola]